MSAQTTIDSFQCRRTLDVDGRQYEYFSLPEAEKNGLAGISRLPFSLKVLLENLLRFEDGQTVTADDIRAMAAWLEAKTSDREIAYRPARVLMQDFTGVPAVVDLAAMRDAMLALSGDAAKINPLVPVDLVIDHSVMVDEFGTPSAFQANVAREYERNRERYEFLRWGAGAFDNFRVVPPGTGICHQVNLEYLAQTVWTKTVKTDNGETLQAFPDTVVGTDSHTTMINGQAETDHLRDDHGDRLAEQASRGRDRHRPRAHGHADAAQERRGEQVRRVLRAGTVRPGAGGQGDDRQHGAGIRCDLRLFPRR